MTRPVVMIVGAGSLGPALREAIANAAVALVDANRLLEGQLKRAAIELAELGAALQAPAIDVSMIKRPIERPAEPFLPRERTHPTSPRASMRQRRR